MTFILGAIAVLVIEALGLGLAICIGKLLKTGEAQGFSRAG